MARTASLRDADVFAAVGRELVEVGNLTVDGLKARTGLSIGSIYHRFGSREGLMAATWLAAVGAFQADFLEALEGADLASGERAARVTPGFCRSSPERAAVLACCRRVEFIGPKTSPDLAEQVARANDAALEGIQAFADRVERPLLACRLALVDFPLAAVRPYLPGGALPDALDDYVARAYRAVMRVSRGA